MRDDVELFIMKMNKKNIMLTYLQRLNTAITSLKKAENIAIHLPELKINHEQELMDLEDAKYKVEKMAKIIREEIKQLEKETRGK